MYNIHFFVPENYAEGPQKGDSKGNKDLTDDISK